MRGLTSDASINNAFHATPFDTVQVHCEPLFFAHCELAASMADSHRSRRSSVGRCSVSFSNSPSSLVNCSNRGKELQHVEAGETA